MSTTTTSSMLGYNECLTTDHAAYGGKPCVVLSYSSPNGEVFKARECIMLVPDLDVAEAIQDAICAMFPHIGAMIL